MLKEVAPKFMNSKFRDFIEGGIFLYNNEFLVDAEYEPFEEGKTIFNSHESLIKLDPEFRVLCAHAYFGRNSAIDENLSESFLEKVKVLEGRILDLCRPDNETLLNLRHYQRELFKPPEEKTNKLRWAALALVILVVVYLMLRGSI